MVAYNFKARFVPQIKLGLGELPLPAWDDRPPKTHTIRTNRGGLRSRHAYPGEIIQLYCGMRTRKCFKIGEAKCTGVGPIFIHVTAGRIMVDGDWVADINEFARSDGFMSWDEMQSFWRDTYLDPTFQGTIIYWTPLEGNK